MMNLNACCETQRPLSEDSSSFVDLTRDYGFKIVMADEGHPELMLGFLNAVIPDREIVSIRFLNTELLPSEEEDHRASYDVLCTDSDGNRFLTEMQKEPYHCFPDRLAVYAGGQTSHLLKKGESYTNVRALYVISVLNGYLKVKDEDIPRRDALLRRAGLRMTDSGNTLTDRVNFIFLQLPAAKAPDSGSAFIERWAWYVREMVNYNEKPEDLDEYFNLLFEASRRRNIEQCKLSIYDNMVRDEIQIAAEREYAVEEALAKGKAEGKAEGIAEGKAEGRAEGIAEGKAEGIAEGIAEGKAEGIAEGKAEGKVEMAKNLKAAGVAIETISQCSGLSVEEVNAL